MSIPFRQRTPGEYGKIARKRKWLIILPAIAITMAVAVVVIQLPDLYQSSTLIVVRPSTLPNSVVPTITEDGLTRQIKSIAQVVTSRSSLEPLIEKYDLYKTEKMRGEPMELLIEYMRKSIRLRRIPVVTTLPTDSILSTVDVMQRPRKQSPPNWQANISTSKQEHH